MLKQKILLYATMLFTIISCTKKSVGEDDSIAYLYVQSAPKASLTPVNASAKEFILTLENVDSKTIYFSDRPVRDAGHVATGSFIANWGKGDNSFSDDPPNAALSIDSAGSKDSEVYVMELKNPTFNANNNRLTYDATVLQSPKKGLRFFSKYKSDRLKSKTTFASATLFIDSFKKTSACSVNNRRTILTPKNMKFWDELNSCGSHSMGNTKETATCMRKHYPQLSNSCSHCFGLLTNCVKDKCWSHCLFSHTSEGCENCAEKNCLNSKAKTGFNLSKCTGIPSSEMPKKQ